MQLSFFWQHFYNFLSPAITLFVGFFAIGMYGKQKRDYKRDVALLISQEVRYAEQQVGNARTYSPDGKNYPLSLKLLPTNSWYKNIHLFINDFREPQIDAISRFYAQVEYMDIIIERISDYKTSIISQTMLDETEQTIEKIPILPERVYLSQIPNFLLALLKKNFQQGENKNIENPPATIQYNQQTIPPTSSQKKVNMHLEAGDILHEVSKKVEFILNTPIGEKFKEISEKKFFGFY